MLIGPYVNGSAIIIGGLVGALAGGKLPERVKTALPMTFGLCSVVQGLSHEEFTEKFVAILVLFCASGTGVFGAMTEGMSGDPSILYIKTILDLFTAGIFATLLGYAVMTIAIP